MHACTGCLPRSLRSFELLSGSLQGHHPLKGCAGLGGGFVKER